MKTILIVDDEFAIVDTLTDLLSEEGYNVVSAANGKLALQVLEVSIPDVVVTDVMMPVLDGRAFVQKMRQTPAWANIPVIFMSAVPRYAAFPAALKAPPFSAYLRKPFDIQDLLSALQAALS